MITIKKISVSAIMASLLGVVWALPATAIVLPDQPTLGVSPTLADPIPTVDGVPVASLHDDFWSYSNQILRVIQKTDETILPEETFGNYAFATGTGGLDVLLYTGSDGQNNVGVGPGGAFTFEDPEQNVNNTTSFNGVWGLGDNDNGPVTVGQVLDYLQAFDPAFDTPAFYLDMNQTGRSSSFSFEGVVYLLDLGADGEIGGTGPNEDNRIIEWAFDSLFQSGDGDYDPGESVPVQAVVDLSPLYPAFSTYDYGTINHNLGSGKADYLAFAPTMNLTGYDRNLLFVTDFTISGLNDGFEEIFMTALGSRTPPPPIPEPTTFLLLGIGLLGLGWYGRQRKKE